MNGWGWQGTNTLSCKVSKREVSNIYPTFLYELYRYVPKQEMTGSIPDNEWKQNEEIQISPFCSPSWKKRTRQLEELCQLENKGEVSVCAAEHGTTCSRLARGPNLDPVRPLDPAADSWEDWERRDTPNRASGIQTGRHSTGQRAWFFKSIYIYVNF